ncbi:hypothetical protein DT019_32105 [Streptomyces sp. SDr-06]|uniref:hypothetical protein n=1 Tax=Streptomyces sp. SDr-06 TaxID=2267702 RepID=UPI000DE88CC6|nr:hypothetical protein [Streptomyces sp. SDr-06]RCH64545.1 hypothetical protein DT019_32105 [Streptomyces sp. SDr-06]
MTQSRQGDEPQLPAVRPAHEGVVLPADGSGPRAGEPLPAPPGAQPWDQPWGPQGHASQPPPPLARPQGPATIGQPLPPENGGRDADATQYIAPVPGDSGSEATQYLAPVPGGNNGDSEATQYIAPMPGSSGSEATQYIGPLPGGHGDSEATQYIAAAPGSSGSEATQYIAPVPAGSGGEATQYIAPVSGRAGALPPEHAGESTAFLGAQAPGQDAGPTQMLPPVPPPPQDAPYGIRPGAPGERQPPAEFDSLFRADGPPQQGAESAQLPRFQPSVPLNRPQSQAPYQPPQAPGPQFAAQPPYQEPGGQPSGYGPEAPRRKSRVGLIAAVVVGCAAIGLGAGALLSGGGDDAKKDDKQPAGVSSPATGDGGGAKAADDPAKAQAEALDKVLADSGNSRDAVIGAVADIRKCDKLDQAAATLRSAAKQRGDLVTRLGQLSVDKLPNHDQLSAALTKAWQSSAAADDHYAAWADAVAGDKGKGCKDGHAKRTKDAGLGDKASGDATKSKQEASGLWNAIATKWNLTKRGATQL